VENHEPSLWHGICRSTIRYPWFFPGVGSFVSSKVNRIVAGIENLTPWTEAIRNAGFEVEDRILTSEWVSIGESEADFLEVATGSPGLKIESIRLADGEPIIYACDLLPSSVVSSSEVFSLRKENNSIITFLDAIQRSPKNYISTIQAVKAGSVSKILSIEEDAPLILLEGTLYDYASLPVAFSKYYFRSDKYQFTLVRSRKNFSKNGVTLIS
jgi:GntR family transcriptional regulator